MKALLKLNILLFAVIMGFSSCKKNDGYSDKIETNITPQDSTTQTVQDTATSSTNITTTQTPTSANGNTDSLSTAGRGSGPGESVKDGSTYTPSKGVQKDSVKLKTESAKKKK